MRVLLDALTISARVRELGRQVEQEYRGRQLTILAVLNGSLIFLADLIRTIEIPHRIGLLQASSYRGTATRPGELTVNTSLLPDIRNRHVLLVDDIFDTGQTLIRLRDLLQAQQPLSVSTCVLLWKTERTEVSLRPDYVGFKIPNEFVVGYGLDFNDDYRHLPYLGVLDDNASA